MKKYTESIKRQFAEIERVKAQLADKLKEIEADPTRSGNYKHEQALAAEQHAREALEAILEQSEPLVNALEAAAKAVTGLFDYAKIAGAVAFIKASGADLPMQAAEQMIAGCKGYPAELNYLSSLFEKNGAMDAAISAKEAADAASLKFSLPQRVSDSLYYSVTCASPERPVDFSGLSSELDTFAEAFPEPSEE